MKSRRTIVGKKRGLPASPLRKSSPVQSAMVLALQASGAGAWGTNTTTGETFWDERVAEILGVPPEEAATAAMDWTSFIEPEDRPRVKQAFEAASSGTGPPYDVECRVRRRDGEQRWLASRGSLVVGEAGGVWMIGLVWDITTVKRNEERMASQTRKCATDLALNETLFRTVFEQAPIGIDLVAPDGTPIRVNWALQEILGYSEAEMRGRRFIEWTHPDDVEASLAMVEALGEGKARRLTMEKRYVRKNGKIVWAKTTVAPVLDRAGGLEFFIAMVEDITARKELETRLQDALNLLENVYASLEEAVFVVAAATRRIVSCNSAAERMFGYSRAEMIGRNTLFLHVSRKSHGEFGRLMFSALDSQGVFHHQFTLRRRNGIVFPSGHTVKDFRDGVGVRLVISVIRDLTAGVRAAAELADRETALRENSGRLQEMNIALKVLLDQREREKRTGEENLSANVSGLLLPLLDRFRNSGPTPAQAGLLDVLEANLREIGRPYADHAAGRLMRLSQGEMKVAGLIRQGLDSKAIAARLGLSVRTVEFHRDAIRKKLGIKSRKVNLETFLSKIM